MSKLILINGCGGAGKDSTGQELLKNISNATLLDIKGLSRTNPWEYSDFEIGLKNAASLINNFYKAGYENIIFTGGLNTQERIDYLIPLLPKGLSLFYFWLDVTKALRDKRRISRARDEADNAVYLDSIDEVFTDPGEILIEGVCSRIKAEDLAIGDVVDIVKSSIAEA